MIFSFTKYGLNIGNFRISWILFSGFIFSLVALLAVTLVETPISKKSDVNNNPSSSTTTTSQNQNTPNSGTGASSSKSKTTSYGTSSTGSNGSSNSGQGGSGATQNCVIALGDSITNAASPQPDMVGDNKSYSFSTGTNIGSLYLYIRNQGINVSPVNLAVSGARSNDVLGGQAPSVNQYNPRYITLLVGGNDILTYTPISTFQSNLSAIADQIQGSGREVLIGTIPNYVEMKRAAFPACEPHLSEIEEAALAAALSLYNSAISNVASQHGFKVINLYPYLGQGDISEYDCLHPNLSGQQKIANQFISGL